MTDQKRSGLSNTEIAAHSQAGVRLLRRPQPQACDAKAPGNVATGRRGRLHTPNRIAPDPPPRRQTRPPRHCVGTQTTRRRVAPARPESPRASANSPARPAGRFAPAPFEHPPTAPACAPDSPHRLAVRARPPRILPRFGDPACAPRRRAIRARALRASADGPRLRARFPASAGGSRPPAPNPPALRRARLRAPPPGDSRPRPSSIRRRPPPARPIPRIGWRFAPARPESSRAPAAPPARPAAGRFAPARRESVRRRRTPPRTPPARPEGAECERRTPSAVRTRKSRADAPQGRRGLRIGESARRPQGRCAERQVVQTHVWKFTRRGSPQLRSPRRGADPARGFPETDRRRRVLRARMPDRGPQAGGA